jgi:hypothetical protein
MLTTAYLLAGPSTPERDILPIQVRGGGGRGTDLLTSYKLKCITPQAMGRPCPKELAEAPYRKKTS